MANASTTDEKNAALFTAIGTDHADEVRELIATGANPNARNDKGQAALYLAASKGFTSCVDALLESGARVNLMGSRDTWSDSCSALNAAIAGAKLRTAELLLDHGADPRITNGEHNTAPHVLIRELKTILRDDSEDAYSVEGALHVLNRLLVVGIDVDQRNTKGQTILDTAVMQGLPPIFVQTLLARGASTGMEGARIRCDHRVWFEEDLDVLRLLVSEGANINARDTQGRSILSNAGDLATLDEMMRLGADIDQADDNGKNTLAFFLGKTTMGTHGLAIMMRLVDAGIDLDHQDYSGESVTSILEQRHDPVAEQMKSAISARRAKFAMAAAISPRRQIASRAGICRAA
jgi:ankyrin repeat protein